MLFSSHIFLFYFLPAALAVYYALPRRGRHLALTLLSYGFYGWVNPLFCALMFFQSAVDWGAGILLGEARPDSSAKPDPKTGRLPILHTRKQKAVLAASLTSNLALLAFFKYFNFATQSWDGLMSLLGLSSHALDLAFQVTLPLGISFYTFQSMSYTIDVWRGNTRVMRNFLDYCCYVALFPQLVAGPIIRFSEVASQLAGRTHTLEKFARGSAFVAFGLAKKVLLANPCGKIADLVFDAGTRSALDAWWGAFAFSFQVYFDFSAYSDIAVGLGLMLGFVYAKNFDSPYLATSLGEYWRRWHISLSSWLRDYLYVPLGGNRKGANRAMANMWVTMLLGGLWHGASWNFVIWGALHAVLLTIERLRGGRPLWSSLPRTAQIAVMFVVGAAVRVPFRASDLSATVSMWASMFGVGRVAPGASLVGGLAYQGYYLVTFAAAALVTWTCPQVWDFTRRVTWPKALLALGVLWASFFVLATQQYNPFIYFIF